MRIKPEQLKAAIAPADYYQHELPGAILKKYGWNDAGLCIFHNDTQKGSFRINTQTGAYCCFACQIKGGDIIAFEMNKYGLNFTEALVTLAEKWGLT